MSCFLFLSLYENRYTIFAALENGGLNSQLMMNPFTLMGGLGGGAGLNPFAGLPGSMGGSSNMTPAMLSNLYMQGGYNTNRRPPGMMEQVRIQTGLEQMETWAAQPLVFLISVVGGWGGRAGKDF